MATLRDEHRPSQRDIEGVLEDLDPIYRGADDCDDSETLESWASTLDHVINRLTYLAHDWHRYARIAEEDEADEETCPYCDLPLDECGCHEDEKFCTRCNCRMPLDCSEHDDTGICEDCVGR